MVPMHSRASRAPRVSHFSYEKNGVPTVGLEPTRPCGHKILSLARLPFRHVGFKEAAKYGFRQLFASFLVHQVSL